jgi:glycosyltransferase involved in cell wall biosynthesis
MRVAIVVEAIPPYCGGAEHVAWVHAIEMAKVCDVSVVTFGDNCGRSIREGVDVHMLPKRKRMFSAYSTWERGRLNNCIELIAPDVIHCHMPNVLSACIDKRGCVLVSTIHDGVPENELTQVKGMSRSRWLKFKLLRWLNMRKSDRVTCVSQHSKDVMCDLYPKYAARISFIPNPIHERFFAPVADLDTGYVLNFGRQIELKMGALLEVARHMGSTDFVFVGSGNMVREYGLPNVRFAGFCEAVERYIDGAAICVFPSLSENFPLVGLEAMARGKPVIATRRGFSEYIHDMENGLLIDSTKPSEIGAAIDLLMKNKGLRDRLGRSARQTAEAYRPSQVVAQYLQLYRTMRRASMNEIGLV